MPRARTSRQPWRAAPSGASGIDPDTVANPREHDHVATAVIQHVMHRQAGDEPHHLASRVLHSTQKYAGKLFRPDHVFEIVRSASQPHHQWRTLQSYGPDQLNDLLDHVFKQSGELRQPMENVGDESRQAHADSFAARVRGYQRGDLAEDLIEAARAGDLDRALDEALRLVQPGSAGWTDRSFGDAERRQEIRRRVHAQGHASKRGIPPLHTQHRDWLRGSIRTLGSKE